MKFINQNEKWLLTAAKLAIFVPPAILLVLGIIARLGWFVHNQTIANRFIEIILAVVFYIPPLAGLIIFLLTLYVWQNRKANGSIFSPKQSLVYAGLAVLSPIWLFILWLFITGFNR